MFRSPRLARLYSKFKRFPWSLGFALGIIIFVTPHPDWHGDLMAFREWPEALRHPFWARWLFDLLRLPPEPVAFVLLSLACVFCMYFAVRVFGGKHWMVFTSFAFAWTLYYGQIDGLVVGGLALAWWAMKHDHPIWLGAGLTLASIKPHLALPMALAIWWWSPSRLKSLLVPGMVVLASFIRWGWWVPEWLSNVNAAYDLTELTRNLSFWTVLGPWVLLAWPILYLLPTSREKKLTIIALGTALTVPYFPLPSAILFLCMPVAWWGYALLQIPLLSAWSSSYWYYDWMKLVPLGLLIWEIGPTLITLKNRLQDKSTTSSDNQPL